jgi:hypothetical protein
METVSNAGRDALINLIDYTPLELFLFAGGCLLWVVAYGLLIRNGIRYKLIEMPAIAAASNFAWEALWSTAFETDMGILLIWTYRAWILFDLVIFTMVLKYGAKLVETPSLRRHFAPATFGAMLAFVVLYYFFTAQGHDTSIGANSAYIAQLFISVYYVLLVLQRSDFTGFSLPFAYLRTIGTGMNTVFMIIHYTDNHWLHAMGLFALVLDVFYIVTFTRKRQLNTDRLPDTRHE